jgi:hypothetical protein
VAGEAHTRVGVCADKRDSPELGHDGLLRRLPMAQAGSTRIVATRHSATFQRSGSRRLFSRLRATSECRQRVEQRQYLTVNIIPLIRLGWSLLETFARRRRRPAGMENEGDLSEAKLNPSHRFAAWVDQPKTRARYG